MNRSKVLFLAHRIPYPPNKGDKIRSYNEIKYLSKFHDIHLAALVDDPCDLKYQENLRKHCDVVHLYQINPLRNKIKSIFQLPKRKNLSTGYFYSKILQSKIDNLLENNDYDAVICFSSPMAEYIFSSRYWDTKASKLRKADLNQSGCPRLIMDFCDLDSDKWRQYSQKVSFPYNLIYRMESSLLLKYEIKVFQNFNQSIFISKQEAELFKSLVPEAENIHVIPNGVDYDYFKPLNDTEKGRNDNLVLLFTGAMDYHANADGVVWFSNEIYPKIRKIHPGAEFYIVGNNPNRMVRNLGKIDGIHVTGFVEDIREYYTIADICIIPLRVARGVQNKVLEAMAMEKPVITTPSAAEGINAEDGRHLLVCETASQFADSILQMHNSSADKKRIASEGRHFIIENYNWDNHMENLNRML